MPDATFRGDPYTVLGVSPDASDATIKRRWRELARAHHPDRAAGNGDETERLTIRMARINAAHDLLRDPLRRARYDASPQSWRAREGRASGAGAAWGRATETGHPGARGQYGPPPPPPTTPVTARYDTSSAFHGRNATTSRGRSPLAGHPPLSRHRGRGLDLRASTPTGPVRRRQSAPLPRQPSLEEARSTVLGFGRFHGHSLGDVAAMEPTYIDWVAQTITRDHDLVRSARVIQADLDERGVERVVPSGRRGFGSPRTSTDDGAGAASATPQ